MAWEGSEDDKTLIIGNYTLRVEQMDTNRWWWSVSFLDEEVASDSMVEKFANTMSKAQYYAVYHKTIHEKTNKKK